jgi:NAD(P)H-hydrate epimerase
MGTTKILTAPQMRWADSEAMASGVSGYQLMDRAGLAVANAVLEHMPDYGRVVIVAGAGNNGGDGFAAATYLRQKKMPVAVVSLIPFDGIKGDAFTHAERARAAGVEICIATGDDVPELDRWLNRAVMIVDAIFGTGLTRQVVGRAAAAIEKINRLGRPVLSVDIASGLNADTGVAQGVAVRADFTLPIAACKWGNWLAEARDYSGVMLAAAAIGISDSIICDSWLAVQGCLIGCSQSCFKSACLIDEDTLDQAWPLRPRVSNKSSYGHVWVFGGSVGYVGAPVLAARGAFAAGAGRVSIACPDDVWSVIAAGSLETMVHPDLSAPWRQADAIVAGPGWGQQRQELLATLLAAGGPLVLDADALNMIAGSDDLQAALYARDATTVITPHPGEAARLLQEDVSGIQLDRKRAVLRLIRKFACWAVLKGNETLVASPDGEIYLNPFGSPRLAVAGSGDVLAGMIAAQLASAAKRGKNISLLVSAAVALHGKAGECSGWYLAGELAEQVAKLRHALEYDDGKG